MSDGIVKYKTAFSQPLLFEGVEFKTETSAITPTDIDACLEFKDRLFVLVEVKSNGLELSPGQKCAYERICKSISATGRVSVVFKCWHSIKKPDPVFLRRLFVQSFYWKTRKGWAWIDKKEPKLLIECINDLLEHSGIDERQVQRCHIESENKLLSNDDAINLDDWPF